MKKNFLRNRKQHKTRGGVEKKSFCAIENKRGAIENTIKTIGGSKKRSLANHVCQNFPYKTLNFSKILASNRIATHAEKQRIDHMMMGIDGDDDDPYPVWLKNLM